MFGEPYKKGSKEMSFHVAVVGAIMTAAAVVPLRVLLSPCFCNYFFLRIQTSFHAIHNTHTHTQT